MGKKLSLLILWTRHLPGRREENKEKFNNDKNESWTSRTMKNSNESRTTVGSKERDDGPESRTNLCVYGLNF
jgi:hypothetical protein